MALWLPSRDETKSLAKIIITFSQKSLQKLLQKVTNVLQKWQTYQQYVKQNIHFLFFIFAKVYVTVEFFRKDVCLQIFVFPKVFAKNA